MTNSTVQEIKRLHLKLSAIYHLGALTPAEQVEVDGLWARIERLTTTAVAMGVKENKARQALIAARANEGIE